LSEGCALAIQPVEIVALPIGAVVALVPMDPSDRVIEDSPALLYRPAEAMQAALGS
jgi:hypothetical protein